MLWAIDVGNTHSVVGLWDGLGWASVWRFGSSAELTEDQWAAQLEPLCRIAQVPFSATGIAIASVVPAADHALTKFCRGYWKLEPYFLRTGSQVGINVSYDPPQAVGADRIANVLAALHEGPGPWIIVDFGTATTLDAVDATGTYLGGAIMTGIEVSMQALFQRAAKLPQVRLEAPRSAIGKNTPEALQAGIVLGYAGAVNELTTKMKEELNGAKVLATGGYAKLFIGLCPDILRIEPNLTLDGLRIAFEGASPR